MFLLSLLVIGLFLGPRHPDIYPILFVTLGFALIGFLDDFLKVVLRRSDGLLAWQKMGLQLVVSTIFLIYLLKTSDSITSMIVPFSHGASVSVGYFGILLYYFAILGTVNGVNFTDGLDGLSSCVTCVVTVFFTIASMYLDVDIQVITLAILGGLLSFLLFNCYPAKIFMGDTGSLALGGFVASTAYVLKMPLFILIVGLIYLIEVLSVILQVGYFKLTHGKRIFRMAPIHHHFELGGWSEIKVVCVFSIVTLLLCMVGWIGLIW